MAQLIGTASNQVPTNGDLGTAAFMDTNAFYGTSLSPVLRNKLINGDMRVDQRNSGAEVTVTGSLSSVNFFIVDRWFVYGTTNIYNKIKGQRVSDVPAGQGLSYSLKLTLVTSLSTVTGDEVGLVQRVEGFNWAEMGWGTTSAKPVTISFWIKNSVPGKYSIGFTNQNNSSAGWRGYVANYTVNAANTWEYKTVTVPGDVSGTWGIGNDVGLYMWFDLGTGYNTTTTQAANSWSSNPSFRSPDSTQWMAQTSSSTLNITGVQLEKGNQATSFEFLPYGFQLFQCQRYWYQHVHGGNSGTRIDPLAVLYSTTGWEGAWSSSVRTPVPLRAVPTMTTTLAYVIHTGDTYSTITYTSISPRNIGGGIYTLAGYGAVGTAGAKGTIMFTAGSGTTTFDAEL